MNMYSYESNSYMLQSYLKLLSDENKLKIVRHLQKGEECVCSIAESLSLEQSLVSHHINSLRKAGLIKDRRVGKWIHVSLNVEAFKKIEELFIAQFSYKLISDRPCQDHDACRIC